MSKEAMRLKAQINNYAKQSGLPAQVILQNFMFERFLERLSRSEYREKFIIKGGVLIANLVGINTRSTMDLDATLQQLQLTDENIKQALEEIINIHLDDNVVFKFVSLAPIRKDDIFGGRCARINAKFDTINTPLSIDISTGDIITPEPIEYEFGGLFDDDARIQLLGYNIETILAEKIETILSRGVFSTRPRDYYDVYVLSKTQKYDKSLALQALEETSKHRGSHDKISDKSAIIKSITQSTELRNMWQKYQKKFNYAANISFENTLQVLEQILNEEK